MAVKKLSKSDKETIEFEDFLVQSNYVLPGDYYSDRLLRSRLLNTFFVGLHKLSLFLYYNLINTSLQSKDTAVRRRLFAAHEAYRPAAAPRGGGHEKDDERVGASKNVNAKTLIKFPKQRGAAFLYFFAFQLLIYFHYMIALIVLNNSDNKKYGISCSNGLQTHQTLVSIIHEPVTLSVSKSDNEQLAACFKKLEAYVLERYGKFYVWNMTVGYLSTPLMENWLLVEQHPALQMFSDEVTLFCHTIGSFFLTSGVLGCLLSGFKPYNVTPLVFGYDPRYSAYLIKSRIQHYLEIIRTSYRNFWCIYQIDHDQTVCECLANFNHHNEQQQQQQQQHEFSLTNQQVAAERPVPHAMASPRGRPKFNSDYFDEYIPSARSQSWRQVLLIGGPIFKLIAATFVTVTLAIMYIIFVQGNARAVELNQELKLFLSEGIEPPNFGETIYQHCNGMTSGEDKDQERQELASIVRWAIIEHLSGALRSFSPDLSRLKRNAVEFNYTRHLMESPLDFGLTATSTTATTTTNNYFSESLNNYNSEYKDNYADGESEMMVNREIVINSIAPTRTPSLVNWTVPVIGGLMTGVIFSLYLIIFVTVIADLCFWLFEIRMKLDICKYLLKLLDNQTPSLGERQVGSSMMSYVGVGNSTASLPGGDENGVFNSNMHSNIRPTFALPMYSRQLNLSASSRMFQEMHSDWDGSGGGGGDNGSTKSLPGWPLGETSSPRQLSILGKKQLFSYPDVGGGGGQQGGMTLLNKAHESQQENEVKGLVAASCNVDAWQVIQYITLSHSQRQDMCELYARHIVRADKLICAQYGLRSFKQCSESFLTSAYLNFRLFLEQIEACRFSINFMISYTVLHALDIIATSQYTDLLRSKIGFMGCGYVLANISLIGSSFFQSQCTKLISPIYSVLAAGLNGDKTIKHLSSLWHRALIDLSGSRSKFSFRVYSVNISYATALQFNLGVTSLYILTLDKMRYRT